MDVVQLLVLAIVQGLTEFLPVSSSAHLILVPVIFGWPDQGLAYDVAVHVGTLAAVVLYFRRELMQLTRASWTWLRFREPSAEARLALAVVLGTIPVGLAGLLFKDVVEHGLRSPLVLGIATLVFGLLLGVADRVGRGRRDEYQLTWRDVLLIGLAQAMALIPGTSRSGITMTAGLMLGLSRMAAARFSFLLSIPVIVLAGGLETLDLIQADIAVDWSTLGLAALASGIAAYACIHLFLALIQRIGMMPFVIYRLVLGVVLIAVFL